MRMLNFMTANLQPQVKRFRAKYSQAQLERLLQAQIENSLELNWDCSNIVIVTNFPFYYKGVTAIHVNDLNTFCLTGSKMFALQAFISKGNIEQDAIIWSHDLDAWQNAEFGPGKPEILDVGAATYTQRKFNGGSVFWKLSAKDIMDEVVETLKKNKAIVEEPVLNSVFKQHCRSFNKKVDKDRVTVLNYTYNVGCSGFVERCERAEKPVRICHFRPYSRISWETFCLDRNDTGFFPVTNRLEQLLRRYYKLPTGLSEEGKRKVQGLRDSRNKIA